MATCSCIIPSGTGSICDVCGLGVINAVSRRLDSREAGWAAYEASRRAISSAERTRGQPTRGQATRRQATRGQPTQHRSPSPTSSFASSLLPRANPAFGQGSAASVGVGLTYQPTEPKSPQSPSKWSTICSPPPTLAFTSLAPPPTGWPRAPGPAVEHRFADQDLVQYVDRFKPGGVGQRLPLHAVDAAVAPATSQVEPGPPVPTFELRGGGGGLYVAGHVTRLNDAEAERAARVVATGVLPRRPARFEGRRPATTIGGQPILDENIARRLPFPLNASPAQSPLPGPAVGTRLRETSPPAGFARVQLVHAPRSPVTLGVGGSSYWSLDYSAERTNAATAGFVAARSGTRGSQRLGPRGGAKGRDAASSGESFYDGRSFGDDLSVGGGASVDGGVSVGGGVSLGTVDSKSSARSSARSVFRCRLDVPTSGYIDPAALPARPINLWQTADAAEGWSPKPTHTGDVR